MAQVILILGNQLFDPKLLRKAHPPAADVTVFMREDRELCTYFKFHKHKIVFFLAAMRTYAEELREAGYRVHYEKLSSKTESYEEALENFLSSKKITRIIHWEIEDKFFEERLENFFRKLELPNQVLQSPMFVTTRDEFGEYLGTVQTPFMRTFYVSQRKRLGVLLEKNEKPLGGKWSFDEDNRKPLPKTVTPPPLPQLKKTAVIADVMELVEKEFPDHPGKASQFWIPVSRKEAKAWLRTFLKERLSDFGAYEDALSPRSDFVFHSVLTPFLNTGLLTPDEVLDMLTKFQEEHELPLSSVEGFTRQIIGWREFIRGIYRYHSEFEEDMNFWKHDRKLGKCWYDGDSGIPPLDNMIGKVNRFAYAHHIERLMVAGNLMLLSGLHPREAHRWFMEMFVDSSDWVMGPNVYGMAIFSDGGLFATKPYICGSNYYRKMGGYSQGDWCDGVDGLYWGFVEKNRKFFESNHRLSMMVRSLDKMSKERMKAIKKAAEGLQGILTQ